MTVGLLGPMAVAQAQTQPAKVQPAKGSPYIMIGTEVWDVPDPVSKRGYQVFVSLPASYGKAPSRRYPVLYVTDAGYAFPLIREIGRRLNFERSQIQEFILVGLSYANGEDGMQSRRRDYTPTPNGPGDAPAGAVLGQGAAYQAYLRDRVMPFIAQRYRTDPRHSLFLGHSYGALLGAQILFTDPRMFSGYILGSPSFWYDKRHIFGVEAAYAARHRDLPARVYMYVGEYESPRFNRIQEMVGDNRAFEARLKKRKYPGLVLKSDVLNGEDHVSVAPRGFTLGLKYLLPVR
jgi:predicted alpha/beta superfamily hydrolase